MNLYAITIIPTMQMTAIGTQIPTIILAFVLVASLVCVWKPFAVISGLYPNEIPFKVLLEDNF